MRNSPYEDIEFNKIDIEQSLLNIENKERSNIFTWNGQFSPQFVEVLIDQYAKEGYSILDPFLGSGTVIYESSKKGYNAYGIELNISAFSMANLYTFINLPIEQRKKILDSTECVLKKRITIENFINSSIKETIKKIYIDYIGSDMEILLRGFFVLIDIDNKKLDYDILFSKWEQLKEQILELPFRNSDINIINGDARNIPVSKGSIDLVITSPPYINVYNYHQQYRKSVETLGYEVLGYAKSEVGSNRKHRSNRFFTAIQYAKDICQVLRELMRVCKDNSRIIFVVGRESKINGVSISNSKLVYRIAIEVLNLNLICKQERVFKNRYGQMIYEDILHFENNRKIDTNTDNEIRQAGCIAVEELKNVNTSVEKNIEELINQAVENVENIETSPISKPTVINKINKIKIEDDNMEEKIVVEESRVHYDKLVAACYENDKLPTNDRLRLEEAIEVYKKWYKQLINVQGNTVEEIVEKMVRLLNEYKLYIDLNLIFDSPEDFLYRQKGQLKLDNTIIEEFLPILVDKCIRKEYSDINFDIGSQTHTFSSVYFNSSLNKPEIGGGMEVKEKDQDFCISRKIYMKSSYSPNFGDDNSIVKATNIGYVVAECKTNLDKTMFQEASATAHDLKIAVSGSKYFLLCDWLDMTPISTGITDIEEILILRKARRIGSHKRKHYSKVEGRIKYREEYKGYLENNPYDYKIILRFVEHIFALIKEEELIESDILNIGYF